MGLGPIMAIYQARFNKYLQDRGIKDTSGSHVWCFIGDGECDEPETLGAITLASRENLDNLIFVINCNLQRLDGPVRGNGKIIQELEGIFRGAGWNVHQSASGATIGTNCSPRTRPACSSSGWAKSSTASIRNTPSCPARISASISSASIPSCSKWSSHLSDEKLKKLRRGGHDPEKVYAAYKAAVECKGTPTVILAKTIKGYGLGEVGEGRNITHQQKKLNEDELREFRSRFGIPISDEEVAKAPFYKPGRRHARDEVSARAAQGAGRLSCRAGRWCRCALKTPKLEDYHAVHRKERRPRSLDHDRRRDADERACSRTRRSANTSCRSCPTNRAPSAWTRSSGSAASTPTSASFTSRSIPINCSTIARRPTARFSKKESPRPARWLRSSPPARPIARTA